MSLDDYKLASPPEIKPEYHNCKYCGERIDVNDHREAEVILGLNSSGFRCADSDGCEQRVEQLKNKIK